MAITTNTADNEKYKFKESSAVSGQPGVVVVNPDGTSIGGSGSSASQFQGAAADNAAAVGNPVRVGQRYNSTAPTYDNGDVADFQADVNGNNKVTLATQIAGEDLTANVIKVEQRFSPRYISTATTTQVKAGAGFLHTITVNGGTAGTIIVYDNTAGSGDFLASFDSTNALATYTFDVTFAVGLTIVTGAATKLTVSYR